MKIKTILPIAILSLLISSCGESRKSPSQMASIQPELGYRTASLLEIDGLQFKDLNQNTQLDPYEDWRLPKEERAKDLAAKMSLAQKAGMMIISSTRLENDWSFERGKNTGEIGSGFNEEDLVMEVNIFTRKPLPVPNMGAAGTSKDVTQFHKRHLILRANPSADLLAEWANNIQALCESDVLGIPATITSNPRNHITTDASIGLSIGKTPFT